MNVRFVVEFLRKNMNELWIKVLVYGIFSSFLDLSNIHLLLLRVSRDRKSQVFFGNFDNNKREKFLMKYNNHAQGKILLQ